MCQSLRAIPILLFLSTIVFSINSSYLEKDRSSISDDLLRKVVNRILEKNLKEVNNNGNNRESSLENNYLDFQSANNGDTPSNNYFLLNSRSPKEFSDEEELLFGSSNPDYDLNDDNLRDISERLNSNPSIRDQEFLQHSTLWGNKYVSGGAGEGKQFLKPEGTIINQPQVKTDSNLPAYCNPPNPCPVGVEEDEGCMSEYNFENTAAFSRQYQSQQDCMCDSEHMFTCPNTKEQSEADFNDFVNFKNFNENPYLNGERLPVAAKKGHHFAPILTF